MLDSERDTIAITMRMLGYSMNSKDDRELEDAKNALIAQKDVVLAYCGDEVKDKMIDNEGAMTIAWSGDAFYCIEENPDLAYAVPEEGSNLWFDSMVIPKTTTHKDEAEKFINFMCRPDIALMNAEYIGYSTANEAAVAMMDEEIQNDPLRYPDLSTLQNMEVFTYDKELSRKISDIWLRFKIG
jgi:spermidine/putrescine transport system substrate-binding protein